MAKMRVAFVVNGSRGDFQPYLSLAVELQKREHVLKMYTAEDHCRMASDFGFATAVSTKNSQDFVTSPKVKKAMESGDWGAVAGKIYANLKLDEDDDVFNDRMAADLREFAPDVIVFNNLGMTTMLEAAAAGAPEAPRVDVELQRESFPSNDYKSNGFHRDLPDPNTPPILTFLWGIGVTDQLVDDYKKAFAEKSREDILKMIDAKPTPEARFEQSFEPERWLAPRFVACSPTLFARPEDWPKGNDFVKVPGCLKLSKEFQDEHARKGSKYFSVGSEYELCKEFIAKNGPPVYVGWGSMMVYTAAHMTLLAVRALKRSGEKGVVLAGWAQIGPDHLAGAENEEELREWCKDNVLFVKAAPHELLFPQCKVAVHHGGIGTAQASISAGCPTIITPAFSDQFDNADAVVQAGCGVRTTRLGLLEYEELGDAIKEVCSSSKYGENAKAKAAAMASEDAVSEMSSWLETFHAQDVKTGKYKERYLANKERLYQLRQKNVKMSSGQLFAKNMSVVMGKYPAMRTWQANNLRFMGQAADLATQGKLWWIQGATVLARQGEGLKTPEVGRFSRFAFIEELERKGNRIHVRRLRGKGPDEGWVTPSLKSKDVAAKVTDPLEVGKISQMEFDELFADMVSDEGGD